MLYMKSLFEKAEDSDGVRILVSRYMPKNSNRGEGFVWDIHAPGVAPDHRLLNAFRNKKVRFPIFIRDYLNSLRENIDAAFFMRSIASESLKGPVTLICFERTDTFCHRRILREVLDRIVKRAEFQHQLIWVASVVPAVDDVYSKYQSKIEEVSKIEETVEETPRETIKE